MTDKEQELVEIYLSCKRKEQEAKAYGVQTLRELGKLAPHKVGEIVKWTEHRSKNVGSWLYPRFESLPPVEKKAVVVRVSANVYKYGNKEPSLDYRYEFKPFKKDGSLSQNGCYPNIELIEWTGEMYDLNKE